MQSQEANRQGRENEEGRWWTETQRYTADLAAFPRKSSPLFSQNPFTSGQLNHRTWGRRWLPGSTWPLLITSLSFIIGPTRVNPHPLLSYDVPSLGKLLEKPFHSRWCHASSEPKSAGEVSTSMSLVAARSEPQGAPEPLLQWTKWHSTLGAQTVAEAQSVVGAIRTMASSARLSVT